MRRGGSEELRRAWSFQKAMAIGFISYAKQVHFLMMHTR